MANGSMMMPRAMAETAKSSAANAGEAGAAPESGVAKPVPLEEQTVPPPRHRRLWSDPLSGHGAPRWCLQLRQRRTTWKRLNVRNLDPKLSESSADAVMRWWLLRRRTPPGS